jgi:hypothetical protein
LNVGQHRTYPNPGSSVYVYWNVFTPLVIVDLNTKLNLAVIKYDWVRDENLAYVFTVLVNVEINKKHSPAGNII